MLSPKTRALRAAATLARGMSVVWTHPIFPPAGFCIFETVGNVGYNSDRSSDVDITNIGRDPCLDHC